MNRRLVPEQSAGDSQLAVPALFYPLTQSPLPLSMLTAGITAQGTYAMLGNSPLWETAEKCCGLLESKGVAHAILGGVAVALHGYRRNTVDLDLLIRREESEIVRQTFVDAGLRWDSEHHEFRGDLGVPIQFLLADEPAGNDGALGVRLPDPARPGTVVLLEGLSVLALPRLIEVKLACGLGNLRRTHRDLADVVELIAIHALGKEFAGRLHKNVRKEFRALVEQAQS